MVNYGYLILVVFAPIVIGGIITIFRKKPSVLNQEEYMVLQHTLKTILTDYTTLLNPQLKKLAAKYDTDPKSKTASIDAYNTEVNDLLSKHTKIIIKDFLSEDLRRIVTKYFSENGIVLHILLQLKNQNELE